MLAVELWLEFGASPTGGNWYRAHNASIVGGYLEHRGLAEAESAPERFFMNVALLRVLYAHALAGAPHLALGRLASLGRLLGDPRLGTAGVFISLRRVLPDRYPLDHAVERYIADERRLGRMLDYAVIAPRLQHLYEWSAQELAEPGLLQLVREGNPIYAWPFEEPDTCGASAAHAIRSPRACTPHASSLTQAVVSRIENRRTRDAGVLDPPENESRHPHAHQLGERLDLAPRNRGGGPVSGSVAHRMARASRMHPRRRAAISGPPPVSRNSIFQE